MYAVRATLEILKDNQQESLCMAVDRVKKLWAEVTKLIELRQVIMPLHLTVEERLENITLALMMALKTRATGILDTMEEEDNDKGLSRVL